MLRNAMKIATLISSKSMNGNTKIMWRTNSQASSMKHTFENLLKLSDIPAKDGKVLKFCQDFMKLDGDEKEEIIGFIADQYRFKTDIVKKNAESFITVPANDTAMVMTVAERLKQSLNPAYHNIFTNISKLDNGIKFLVDFRSLILDLLQKLDVSDTRYYPVKHLNIELKNMLAFAFSVGFLSLQRITWESSCDMLEKISEYEAVHPVRNWSDLKRRVGSYRRCYVFTHSSMPKEPIVVLHTALTNDISSSISSIVKSKGFSSDEGLSKEEMREDPNFIQAAIFYSITSTQRGLHGIELGNKLIKKVVGEILKEFPHISKLSSLSPIPGFRDWFLLELKKTKQGLSILPSLLTQDEILNINTVIADHETETSDIWTILLNRLATNHWVKNEQLKDALKQPLLKMCAHYLYREKHRSFALNSVAHFHLRNGAVLWRLNWDGDLSPRGLNNSFGIMANYRYFIDETDTNSQNYGENFAIKISSDVENLLPTLNNKL